MLLFTRDKDRLARHFLKDPVLFAYHLGDLDDHYFSKCQWAADNATWSSIAEVILVYKGGNLPVMLGFGLSPRFEQLLRDMLDLLPDTFYCHYFRTYGHIMHEQFHERHLSTTIRMQLTRDATHETIPPVGQFVRFVPSDADRLNDFYRIAYPDGYFDATLLKLGQSCGIVADGMIVAASGIHCLSVAHHVGVLGSIATHPEWRGNGLASWLTARHAKELQDMGCMVCLNVSKNNAPAVHCYTKLGFEPRHEFEESLFERR